MEPSLSYFCREESDVPRVAVCYDVEQWKGRGRVREWSRHRLVQTGCQADGFIICLRPTHTTPLTAGSWANVIRELPLISARRRGHSIILTHRPAVFGFIAANNIWNSTFPKLFVSLYTQYVYFVKRKMFTYFTSCELASCCPLGCLFPPFFLRTPSLRTWYKRRFNLIW